MNPLLFYKTDEYPPILQYSHYLQVNIVGIGDDPESRSWMGYVESRVRGFPQYLEGLPLQRPIHLYPVQSKTEKSANSVCYFIGFDVDKTRFNPDKPLHVDSCTYNFHKLLIDKYKGVMKDGLDFYVDHYPWKKLPKEVFEGYGGRDKAKELRKARGYGKYRQHVDPKNGNNDTDIVKKEGDEATTNTDQATKMDPSISEIDEEENTTDKTQLAETLRSRKRCFDQTYSLNNFTIHNIPDQDEHNPASTVSGNVYTPGDSGTIPGPITSIADRMKATKITSGDITGMTVRTTNGSKRKRDGVIKKELDQDSKTDDHHTTSDSEDTLQALSQSHNHGIGAQHLLSRSRDVHWLLLR